ncbi:hypothetical protein [Chroococcidiopsis sp. SAG 2025]|nr:hypothetical protein [Chroococcidiopsis sp. SAG 2025]
MIPNSDFCTGGFSREINSLSRKSLVKTRPYEYLTSEFRLLYGRF